MTEMTCKEEGHLWRISPSHLQRNRS